MKDPKFFDNTMSELARRLGITPEQVVEMPIIDVARLMADKGVNMGLTLVSESGSNFGKP